MTIYDLCSVILSDFFDTPSVALIYNGEKMERLGFHENKGDVLFYSGLVNFLIDEFKNNNFERPKKFYLPDESLINKILLEANIEENDCEAILFAGMRQGSIQCLGVNFTAKHFLILEEAFLSQ